MESLISRLDQALNEQIKPVLVFDIDSTIFNVSPRNQDIFDLFCSIYKKQFSILHKVSTEIRLDYKDWGLDPYIKALSETAESEGNTESIHELKKLAKDFWKKHFFAGTFLESDKPYNSAIELVSYLAHKNAKIMYLTGRDNHRMREGSLLQLKHWQLPLKVDSDLITKPHKGMVDGDYKSGALKKIFSDHPEQSVFFFDNEPSVLEHCIFPDKKNYTPVFIESTHSSRSTPQKSWPHLYALAYEDFLTKLKERQEK